ncbi:MAG TPA: hypothetical protein PKW33_05865 [Anaerolineaceae bacterium]|nr:hypothetical protein [Anaerolineaceae bacterium]HPN51094.1 hypothetical protein [Anaerolineaceae bacterium]
MTKRFPILIAAFLLLLGLSATPIGDVYSQNNMLSLVAPAACPSGGCAAGQRLNFRADYAVNPVFSGVNTQVCIYTLLDGDSGAATAPWADHDPLNLQIGATGGLSGAAYTAGETSSLCSGHLPDSSYEFLSGAYAQVNSGAADRLDFAFRIHRQANLNGRVVAQVFQTDASGTWIIPGQSFFLDLNVAAASGTAYTANAPAVCGSNSPCYVSSLDDLAQGYGTGLKDAVDASPGNATILLLGQVMVKGQTVVLQKPQTLLGVSDAILTYLGSTCTNPMLSIQAGVTLRDLNISDGACTVLSRDLLEINSSNTVTLQSLDLISGKNAVHVLDNNGDVWLQFSRVHGNSGYALRRDASMGGSGRLHLDANNLFSNQSGVQVDCASLGSADHNFWGGALASAASTGCSVQDGRRLGAAILPRSGAPGVEAQLINITQTKQSFFSNMIAFQRPAAQPVDFPLFVVNHGSGSTDNIPFYASGAGDITPCGSFWDIFLPENSAVPAGVDVYIKYNHNSGCAEAVETASFWCDSGIASRYPLWWFDPLDRVTAGWDRTGQNPDGLGAGGATGQTTLCLMDSDEIMVSIDTTGRPGVVPDLQHLPLVVGLPGYIELDSFTAYPAGSEVRLQWMTSSEHKVRGFYLLRSTNPTGAFSRASGLIEARGNETIGGIYTYTDTNLPMGTHYYYRIEVISSDYQTCGYYGAVDAEIFTATPTPTRTATNPLPMHTVTPSLTLTQTQTLTLTMTPTMTVTQSLTPTISPTVTLTHTRTLTGAVTRTATRTRTRTAAPPLAATPTRTRTPTQSLTPTRTPPPTRTNFPTRTFTAGPTEPNSAGTPPVPTGTDTITVTAEANLTPGYPAPLTPESGTPAATSTVVKVTGTPQMENATLTPQASVTAGVIEETPTITATATLTAAPQKSGPSVPWAVILLGAGAVSGLLSLGGLALLSRSLPGLQATSETQEAAETTEETAASEAEENDDPTEEPQ